jgi:hypothetical protein
MVSSIKPEMPRRAAAAAAKLGGRPVLKVIPAGKSGNNRTYRVDFDDGTTFALKSYSSQKADPRDRLGTEFSALSFLNRHDVDEVPRAIAMDPDPGYALYEWVDGSPVTTCNDADIDAAIAFTRRLYDLRVADDAAALSVASEACLSGAETLHQVDRRYRRLSEIAVEEPALREFLVSRFEPVRTRVAEWVRDGYAGLGLEFETDLAVAKRTLSPADFGFHNAIRRPDGRLTFIDFEYFGWEDPVRLVAEFTQHPGMDLDPAMAQRFHEGACGLFAADETFDDRLRLLYPALGLRWCMILLNEFLPERWFRRIYAGEKADRAEVLDRQLGKARFRLSKVVEILDGGKIW